MTNDNFDIFLFKFKDRMRCMTTLQIEELVTIITNELTKRK